MDAELERKIDAIQGRDDRFRSEAYHFVLMALSYTIERQPEPGHVSAAQLLQGIRQLGIAQFGPLTREVFRYWGIKKSAEFGDIVFNLIDAGLLGKRDEDRREDFDTAAFDLDTELHDHNC